MVEATELSERASRVLDVLTKRTAARPLFVEFSGSPKSGKSTCIDIVGHFFRRKGFRVLAPTEGASKRTPFYLKGDLVAFNTWSACYALTHLLEGLYHSDKYHIAILDRGLFDALVWFELLARRGLITSEERDRVHSFLMIQKWRSAIHALFLFRANADTSLEREHRDKLIAEPGKAMNPEFLNALNEAYEQVRTRFAETFPHFEVIDTSTPMGTTPKSTSLRVAGVILDLLEREGK